MPDPAFAPLRRILKWDMARAKEVAREAEELAREALASSNRLDAAEDRMRSFPSPTTKTDG